jgi:lipoprotein-anchoring transpeptidase ErfK/SrfK
MNLSCAKLEATMNIKTKAISHVAGLAIGLTAAMSAINPAAAGVDVKVDLTTQTMNVRVDGRHYATWKVSTGKRGYTTPTGRYRVQRMERMHYSRKYDNAPMPHSIFFRGGYAIHATGSISRLGRVASHGCVRLHPSNASKLYSLIRSQGSRSTKISVVRGPKVAKRKTSSYERTASNILKKNRVSKNRKSGRTHVVSSKSGRLFYIFGGLDLTN